MEFIGLAILVIVAGALFLVVAWHFDEQTKLRLAREEERRKNSIEGLRREREAARLRRDIAVIKEQDELRPLVVETKKAILQGRADKRLLDAVFARRALDDVLGMGVPAQESDPIEATVARIMEAIERRRADGAETDDLERALDGLRNLGEKT
jgi:hypothetical protein